MQNGTIVATDRATAMRMIQQKGETPLDLAISDTDAVGGITKARPTISRSDLADLVRELATALEAGLPLMQALRTVRRQASNKNLRVILDFIIARVEAGVPFHTAAKEYGAPFDDMTTGMLRAADASGRTSEILHQLGDLLERSVELRREVVGAVVYPLMIAVLISVSVVVLIAFVLPRVMKPILQANLELPMPTQILMGVSDFVSAWWLVILAAMLLVGVACRNWIAKPLNRLRFDTFLLGLPVVGRLVRDIAVARFTRTLGTLVSAGIPILSALRIVRDTLGNQALMQAIDQVSDKVSTGTSLADPLERSGHFPPLLVQIVNIGERSGRLEQMLLHAAGSFDRQVNNSLKLFTRILPTILLVVMALVASFVLAAILLPIIELQKAAGA
ncbi:MAG: type II secretion system F family protein [Planctomycetota bacterium]|jgi:type II secretory pathway component PulF